MDPELTHKRRHEDAMLVKISIAIMWFIVFLALAEFIATERGTSILLPDGKLVRGSVNRFKPLRHIQPGHVDKE